jgi:hypothetical protein
MKRRTKKKIGKWAGIVGGCALGVGLIFVAIKILGNGSDSGTGTTSGLAAIGKLIGYGMKTGIAICAAGTTGTAVAGGEIGEKVASKIGNKKKKK